MKKIATTKLMKKMAKFYGLSLEHGGLTGSWTRSGGKFADVAKPHLRMFDIPGFKRHVRVTITKYIMGSHRWVKIVEQDNPIWAQNDEGKWCWQIPWDDPEGRGREWDCKYTRTNFIEGFVERTLAENFEPGTYYVERETLGSAVYGREGD